MPAHQVRQRTHRPCDFDAVRALGDAAIPAHAKGFGGTARTSGRSAAEIAADRPTLFDGDFVFPLLVLRDDAVQHNITELAAYCADRAVALAPHAKTTMVPQLFARQLAAGAWGLTAATIGHVQAYRTFGVRRVLLANELVDPAGIAWVAGELAADPRFDFYCYVDSLAGIRLLDEGVRRAAPGRAVRVLVELGHAGGRTGCRTVVSAVEVARAAAATSTLSLGGVAGYEGGLGHAADPDTLDRVAAYCGRLRQLAGTLRDAGLVEPPVVVSAGGSAFFDVIADELRRPGDGSLVVRRSGSYLTHDDGFYATISPFGATGRGERRLAPALRLWAHVLSRPEPTLALLGAGRRDVSFDEGLPVPLLVRHVDGSGAPATGMEVTRLNDQHAYLRLPAGGELAPGDLVCLGISHPCTSFDKWRHIPVLDADDRVCDVVDTFF